MAIQNNKEEVPFAHYAALFRELSPEEAAARCGVPFENGCFTLRPFCSGICWRAGKRRCH